MPRCVKLIKCEHIRVTGYPYNVLQHFSAIGKKCRTKRENTQTRHTHVRHTPRRRVRHLPPSPTSSRECLTVAAARGRVPRTPRASSRRARAACRGSRISNGPRISRRRARGGSVVVRAAAGDGAGRDPSMSTARAASRAVVVAVRFGVRRVVGASLDHLDAAASDDHRVGDLPGHSCPARRSGRRDCARDVQLPDHRRSVPTPR